MFASIIAQSAVAMYGALTVGSETYTYDDSRTKQDVPKVASLLSEIRYCTTEDSVKKFLDNGRICVGLFNSDEQQIGFMMLRKNEVEKKCTIMYFVIGEEYRSKGLGFKFLKTIMAEEEFKGYSFEISSLSERSDNLYRRVDGLTII